MATSTETSMRQAIKRWLNTDNPSAAQLQLPAIEGFDQLDELFETDPGRVINMVFERMQYLRDHLVLDFDLGEGVTPLFFYTYNHNALPYMIRGNELVMEYLAELDDEKRRSGD